MGRRRRRMRRRMEEEEEPEEAEVGEKRKRRPDVEDVEEQKAPRIAPALLEDDPDWIAFQISKNPNVVPASTDALPPVLPSTPTAPATSLEATLTPKVPTQKVKLEPRAEEVVAYAKAKANQCSNAAFAARYARFRKQIAPATDDPIRRSRSTRPPPELALKIRNANPNHFQMFFSVFVRRT